MGGWVFGVWGLNFFLGWGGLFRVLFLRNDLIFLMLYVGSVWLDRK